MKFIFMQDFHGEEYFNDCKEMAYNLIYKNLSTILSEIICILFKINGRSIDEKTIKKIDIFFCYY